VWLKPWKFQISLSIYLLSFAAMMVWLPPAAQRGLLARYVVWMAIFSGMFEVLYITLQGARGLGSHYNLSEPFYALMGLGAVLLTSTALALAILIARDKDYALSPSLKLAIVIGLVLTFFLGAGFGAYLASSPSGHWVSGVAEDAGGMPIFHWSRTGGDLRVAHFFGVHAIQLIPAFATGLNLFNMPQRVASWMVFLFAIALSACCFWTFIQARNGIPFLAM
jgi:hypothetical protein